MKLKDLVGLRVLSGIEVGTIKRESWGYYEDCNYIKFTLDNITYMALENPDDGYRSYMEELKIVDERCSVNLPDIQVTCMMRSNDTWGKNDVLDFIDILSGKQILSIGTMNCDDWYPCCHLEYTPENMHINGG